MCPTACRGGAGCRPSRGPRCRPSRPLAEHDLARLVGLGLRDLRHDADVARHHEIGQPRNQELGQRRGSTVAPGLRTSPRPGPPAPRSRWRTPTATTSSTSGCWRTAALDLERRDVLAAAADRVLDAIDEEEIAVGVLPEQVAGVEPAVAPDRGRRLGHAVVAGVHASRQCRCARSARRWRRAATSTSCSSTRRHCDAAARPAAGAVDLACSRR